MTNSMDSNECEEFEEVEKAISNVMDVEDSDINPFDN